MNKSNFSFRSSTPQIYRILRLCTYVAISMYLSGCAAIALSLVGAGAGAGISHQMNGLASRTFSEPLPKVKKAALVAMRRMTIKVDTTDMTENGQVMRGLVGDLNIEVELETLSNNVTRVSVIARKNILVVDGATAHEIIVQTERALIKS